MISVKLMEDENGGIKLYATSTDALEPTQIEVMALDIVVRALGVNVDEVLRGDDAIVGSERLVEKFESRGIDAN